MASTHVSESNQYRILLYFYTNGFRLSVRKLDILRPMIKAHLDKDEKPKAADFAMKNH